MAKEKGTVTPIWAQSCRKMCQTGLCSQGSRAILNRQNSGRDASINTFSVQQALFSVNKKEACKSLFFHFVIQESLVWGFGYLRNNSTLKRNEKWDESKLIPEFMLARNRGHFYSTPISLQCQYFRCSRPGSKNIPTDGCRCQGKPLLSIRGWLWWYSLCCRPSRTKRSETGSLSFT